MGDRLTHELLEPMRAYHPHPFERVPLLGIVIGGFIANARWGKVAEPIIARVEATLMARANSSFDGWGDDPATQCVALATCKVLVEEMGWSSGRFRPDDEVRVAF